MSAISTPYGIRSDTSRDKNGFGCGFLLMVLLVGIVFGWEFHEEWNTAHHLERATPVGEKK